jgi:glutathione S-transferase
VNASTRPHFILYGRPGCHLCEEMAEGLDHLRKGMNFTYEIVDVDGDPALAARYGKRIPVLVSDGRELCEYVLDSSAIREAVGARPENPA